MPIQLSINIKNYTSYKIKVNTYIYNSSWIFIYYNVNIRE